jgi:hypothetical protein
MYRELRPPIAGGYPEGLAPDPLSQFRVVEELGGGDADGSQLIEEAQFGQLPHAVGEDVDTNAEFPDAGADS